MKTLFVLTTASILMVGCKERQLPPSPVPGTPVPQAADPAVTPPSLHPMATPPGGRTDQGLIAPPGGNADLPGATSPSAPK